LPLFLAQKPRAEIGLIGSGDRQRRVHDREAITRELRQFFSRLSNDSFHKTPFLECGGLAPLWPLIEPYR